MKKLFFSAVALVAFSSVSMANTIADESTKEGTNIDKSKLPPNVTCRRTHTTTCSDGSTSTHTQTASVPSTGDYEVDRGNACAAAASKAKSLSAAGCN